MTNRFNNESTYLNIFYNVIINENKNGNIFVKMFQCMFEVYVRLE